MRRLLLCTITATVAVTSVALPAAATEGTRFREAVRGDAGVIATESPAATEVGLAVLDAGGNAVDAAIATVLAINVARPQSCGIGGGGFAVLRTADGELRALDFREEAPAAYTATTLQTPGINQGFSGHLVVGVPGTVAGLWALHQEFGSTPWADLVAPAATMARDGVVVQQSLSEAMAQAAPRLRLFPSAAEQFLVGGTSPYPPGSTLVQTDLADTLDVLATGGRDAFYEGSIGAAIVAEMEDNAGAYPGDDGVLTMADLQAYEAVWRDPLVGTYRGSTVVAMPPPTSGGVALLEMLNLLEGFDLAAAGHGSTDHIHLVAEAQKLAWADRNAYLADPDHVDVPTATLISKAYADERRPEISTETAGSYDPGVTTAEVRPPGLDANPLGNTTNLSVLDAEGTAIALTCTIEQAFGSAVVATGAGFLLNNELTDFSGPGTANEPGPGKRPRSSISPTIVLDDADRPVLVVGGAGGATIIMGSVHAAINVVDFGMDVARAVDAERWDSTSNPTLNLENVRVDADVQGELTSRGHQLVSQGEYWILPRVQAVGIDPATGEAVATSDSRTDFAAAAQGVEFEPDPVTDPDPDPDADGGGGLAATGGGAVAAALAAVAVGLATRRPRRRA